MEASEFDEAQFFRAIGLSPLRCLLIGRQALIALGIPVMTADYDLWVHVDDVERLNVALEPFGLMPNRSALSAREAGRYVLENDEHVDVLVARSLPTVDGRRLAFDDIWDRREELLVGPNATVSVPCLDDLIATKRLAARPKDAEDIRLLEQLRKKRSS